MTTTNRVLSKLLSAFTILLMLATYSRAVPGVALQPKRRSGSGMEELVAQDTSTKGVQVMITQKMRRTLVDNLGYHDHEVDVLEPQIAAVLIERSLPRPANGMPKSWCVSTARATAASAAARVGEMHNASRESAPRELIRRRISSARESGVFKQLRSVVLSHPVIPIAMATAAVCWWQYPLITGAAKSVASSAASIAIATKTKMGSLLNRPNAVNSDASVPITAKPSTVGTDNEPVAATTSTRTETQITNAPEAPPAVSVPAAPVERPIPVIPFGRGKVRSSNVNVLALEEVFHQSPSDTLHLKFNIFQNKFL